MEDPRGACVCMCVCECVKCRERESSAVSVVISRLTPKETHILHIIFQRKLHHSTVQEKSNLFSLWACQKKHLEQLQSSSSEFFVRVVSLMV